MQVKPTQEQVLQMAESSDVTIYDSDFGIEFVDAERLKKLKEQIIEQVKYDISDKSIARHMIPKLWSDYASEQTEYHFVALVGSQFKFIPQHDLMGLISHINKPLWIISDYISD